MNKSLMKPKRVGLFFRISLVIFILVLTSIIPVPIPTVEASEVIIDNTEKAPEKTVVEAAEEAVEKATAKTVEETAEKAAEKAAEKTAEKIVETSAQKAIEQVTEKAVEKAAEKAEKIATEKEERKARRPNEWEGATKVYYFVFVVDIDEIYDASQNFAANIYLRLRWQDKRLANPKGEMRQIHLEDVWNPRVLLANQQGLVTKSLPEIVQVDPDGMVTYHQRYTGKLSQPLNLYNFPMDKHLFNIQFVAAGYEVDEIGFLPESFHNGGSISDQLSLPDWQLVKHETVTEPFRPIPDIHEAGFTFKFEARRFVLYYIWQVVFPLVVVVVMSWAAFWMKAEETGVRIGVATSSILTLIAHRFILANLLPRLPYMTRLDYFTVVSTLLVFIALITVVVTSYLLRRSDQSMIVHKIDIFARCVLPFGFLLLLGWFFSS